MLHSNAAKEKDTFHTFVVTAIVSKKDKGKRKKKIQEYLLEVYLTL